MKKIILILLFIAVVFSGLFLFYKTANPIKNKATIVILNGPSAAGKTSIQKEFQKLMYEPYLAIGLDNFFVGVLPQHYMGGTPTQLNMPKKDVAWGEFSKKDEFPIFTLHFGVEGQKVISGMHHAIAAYAKQGNNIIVDYILYRPEWLKELVNVLKDYNVIFVGIDIPLELLEQREKQRATSPVGHARSHFDTVYGPNIYDIKCDTSVLTAGQCAQQIRDFIKSGKKPEAFEKLRKLLK